MGGQELHGAPENGDYSLNKPLYPKALAINSPYVFGRMLIVAMYWAEYLSLNRLEEDLESVVMFTTEYDRKKEEMIRKMLGFQAVHTLSLSESVVRYEANHWLDNIWYQLHVHGAYAESKLIYCGVEMLEPDTLLFWRDTTLPCLP